MRTANVDLNAVCVSVDCSNIIIASPPELLSASNGRCQLRSLPRRHPFGIPTGYELSKRQSMRHDDCLYNDRVEDEATSVSARPGCLLAKYADPEDRLCRVLLMAAFLISGINYSRTAR